METVDTPRADRIGEFFRYAVDHANAKTVYADPVTAHGKTIIPVAKIRYGFGGGSGRRPGTEKHGGGGGGGLFAKPLGVIEVTEAETRFVPISPSWTLPAAIALGAVAAFLLTDRLFGSD